MIRQSLGLVRTCSSVNNAKSRVLALPFEPRESQPPLSFFFTLYSPSVESHLPSSHQLQLGQYQPLPLFPQTPFAVLEDQPSSTMGLFNNTVVESIQLGPNRKQLRFVRYPKKSKDTWITSASREVDLYRPKYRRSSSFSDSDDEQVTVYRRSGKPSRYHHDDYSVASGSSSSSSSSRGYNNNKNSYYPGQSYTRANLPAPRGYNLLPAPHTPPPSYHQNRQPSPFPMSSNPHGVIDFGQAGGNIEDHDEIDWANVQPPPPPSVQRRSTVGHGGYGRRGGVQVVDDRFGGDHGGHGGFYSDDEDDGPFVEYREPRHAGGRGYRGYGGGGGSKYIR